MGDTPETMQGRAFVAFGGPERLHWRRALSLPEPVSGGPRIRLRAAAVNNTPLSWHSTRGGSAAVDSGRPDERSGEGVRGDLAPDMRFPCLKDRTIRAGTARDTGGFAAPVQRIEADEMRPPVIQPFAQKALAAAQTVFLQRGHIGRTGIWIDTP